MHIAQVRKMDISNGNGIGVSIFTQGCPYHCSNCHNASIWGFDGGSEYGQKTKKKILRLIQLDYIHRFSILGGEPLLPQNVFDLLDVVQCVKREKPSIEIWLWTGTTLAAIRQLLRGKACDDDKLAALPWNEDSKRYLKELLSNLDYLIDGRFVEAKKDLTLRWRGSSNQKIWTKDEIASYLN